MLGAPHFPCRPDAGSARFAVIVRAEVVEQMIGEGHWTVFFERPAALVLMLIAVAILVVPPILRRRRRAA